MTTASPAQSPRAFLLSVLLHASVVIALLIAAWWSKHRQPEQPQIFELVAGEGNDYAALEAPTTAAPPVPTVKLDLPDPVPVVTPAPEPQRAPVIERAPEPKPTPRETTPPPPKKVEKKAPEKVQKKPEPKRELERTTFDKFRKEHGDPKPVTPRPAPKITPKTINADSIAGRVASNSSNSVKAGAGGTALSRTDSDRWSAYQALIIERIRREMERAGVTDLRSARVQFSVSALGVVSDPRITGGSGSSDFDAAVLRALRSLGTLPIPPSERAETLAVTIEMRERN